MQEYVNRLFGFLGLVRWESNMEWWYEESDESSNCSISMNTKWNEEKQEGT